MSIFKCKMCGGALEVSEGMTVCECEFCGTTQTIPKTRDDVAANLFNRANNLRSKCEFDKAQEIYEKIVNSDPNEAEAYWGIVLCKYGIEYVEDPSTFKKVPTCHRTQLESVQSDVDYKSALEHADSIQRDIYEKEAAEIDRLQKDILAIVRNEKPFDVFICYKETDDSGKRTQDSVIANDIYHQLTQEGFKVFYAAITLEDKLGQEYEPYIFAALNSAKVMLVIGSKPEYFNAVWVKNEWSRFLKIARSDRSKLLIPCYKNMDAYDLPEEFAHLQAQDIGKIGCINDIIRGIKKVLAKPEEKAEKTVAVSSASSANIENFIQRGMLSLEDKDWDRATGFFEQVLNENASESRAYIGELLAEYKLSSEDKLNGLDFDIGENGLFQKAMRYGNDEIKNKLINYRKQCFRNIFKKFTFTAEAGNDKDINNRLVAISGFNVLDGFKKECRDIVNENTYQLALKKYNSNSLNDLGYAIDLFNIIGEYKDSAEQINKFNEKIKEISYNSAVSAYGTDSIDNLKNAEKIFGELGDHKDSAEMLSKTAEKIKGLTYDLAMNNYIQNTIDANKKAQELFNEIQGYKDVSEMLMRCSEQRKELIYNSAMDAFNKGNAVSAKRQFDEIAGYKNSDEMSKHCQKIIENNNKKEKLKEKNKKRAAVGKLFVKRFSKLIIAIVVILLAALCLDKFAHISNFSKINYADSCLEVGRYEEALKYYSEVIAADSDSTTKKALRSLYKKSKSLYDEGDLYDAIAGFEYLDKFLDYKQEMSDTLPAAYISAGQFYNFRYYCLNNNLSFEDVMKNNGCEDIYKEFYDRFQQYQGRYYYFEDYPKLDSYDENKYIEITINEDNWTFNILQSGYYKNGEQGQEDRGLFDFCFEKEPDYIFTKDSDMNNYVCSFSTAGEIDLYQDHASGTNKHGYYVKLERVEEINNGNAADNS